jgi:hypothetical protein
MAAIITVTDAAGRILFRRPATDEEVRSAIAAAEVAAFEARAALGRIYAERTGSARARFDDPAEDVA